MANMRAQVSLQFTDEDLFENFIKPNKEERRLNSIIIKCLSSYYYNEEVRNLVEGVSLEDITDGEQIQSNQALFDEVRQALMMQDFMAQELQNTMNNGVQDVEDILGKTNEMAESTGMAHTEYNPETGNMILRIGELPKVGGTQKSAPKKKSTVSSNQDLRIELLMRAVEALAHASGNKEVEQMLDEVDLENETNEGVVEEISEDNVSNLEAISEVEVLNESDTNELKNEVVVEESTTQDYVNDEDSVSSVEEVEVIIPETNEVESVNTELNTNASPNSEVELDNSKDLVESEEVVQSAESAMQELLSSL